MYDLKKFEDIKIIENQTFDNCLVCIAKSNGEYIKYIKDPDIELIKLSLRINGNNIRFINDKYKTREICELAAIHHAEISLLPIKDDDDITNIVNFLKSYRLLDDFYINGEKTNNKKKFTTELFGYNIKYYRIWEESGFDTNRVENMGYIFKDNKVYRFDTNSRNLEFEKFSNGVSIDNFYGRNGINENYVLKALKKDPNYIFNIKAEDIRTKYIYASASAGLKYEYWDKISRKYEKSICKGIVNYLKNHYNIELFKEYFTNLVYYFNYNMPDYFYIYVNTIFKSAPIFKKEIILNFDFVDKMDIVSKAVTKFGSNYLDEDNIIRRYYLDTNNFTDDEKIELCKHYPSLLFHIKEDFIKNNIYNKNMDIFDKFSKTVGKFEITYFTCVKFIKYMTDEQIVTMCDNLNETSKKAIIRKLNTGDFQDNPNNMMTNLIKEL